MIRPISTVVLVAAVLAFVSVQATAITNPDEITVVFPSFDGPGKLGNNVSTVLALQLAQTMRQTPWPRNPEQHHFGKGLIRYTGVPLPGPTHEAAKAVAEARDVRAQIVVWGRALHYGNDVVVNINVTLPRYRAAPSFGCSRTAQFKCDYRRRHFEAWVVPMGDDDVAVDVPRRRFGLSTVVLKSSLVRSYTSAAGLPIRATVNGGQVIGHTGPNFRFLEFNRVLPNAPALVQSRDVQGYVSLPELSDRVSEYAEMLGGILQYIRGDWEAGTRSFRRVIGNPNTRAPLRVDALLYRAAATMRSGGNGRAELAAAAELAPYDRRVVRYQVMGELSMGGTRGTISQLISAKRFLFAPDDAWVRQVDAWLGDR